MLYSFQKIFTVREKSVGLKKIMNQNVLISGKKRSVEKCITKKKETKVDKIKFSNIEDFTCCVCG